MAAGERDVLVKGLRVRAAALPQRFDPDGVRGVHGDLLALDAYLKANPKAAGPKARHALDRAMTVAETAHAFTTELHGFQAQKKHSESASLYDLSSIGVLAIENLLTADKITLPRILMNSLSEALMFLASRQYVAGASAVLAALYRQNSAHMYRELWTLATDYRKGITAKDAAEIRDAIDGFFRRLEADGVGPEAQIAILREFYALLLVLRVAELLDALGG